ncbi:hypothetical protein AB1L16_07950 [Peribacillus frigoritolerans]|uniref:hypothetical protein n=1 Tax=Peribacillus frigoritolerans TaxID=450367 RepID=UPI0039A21151
MNKVYTLAELVKKFGSKAQKASLKRNKGNITGKEFTLLIKSVMTEWESYTVDGRGSNRLITCSGKHSKRIERVDKRVHNGKGQLAGEFELNSLVLNYLIEKNNQLDPMATTKWITELEIVDVKILRALYGDRGFHLEALQEQFGNVIKEYQKTENDIEMLEDFLNTQIKHIKSSLVSIFHKLAEAKVIIHQIEKWGCTSQNKHRKLKKAEIKWIADIRRKLLNAYGLKSRDLFKKNIKEVKAFKTDFDKELDEQLGLKYYYDAHFCVLQDSDLGVLDYLNKLKQKGELDFAYGLTEVTAFTMLQCYKDMQSKRSLELARKREKNTCNTSDSDRVKSIKIMKQYVRMWELLLEYFKCTSCLGSHPKEVKDSAPAKVEFNSVEIEVSNQSKRTNSPAQFQAIRWFAEMNK